MGSDVAFELVLVLFPRGWRGAAELALELLYTKARKEWVIYWKDRNLRFHRYDLGAPSENVGDLLAEIDSYGLAGRRPSGA